MMRSLVVGCALLLTTGCGVLELGTLALVAGPALGFGFRMAGDAIETHIPSVGKFCATDEGELGIVEADGLTTRVCRPIKEGSISILKTIRKPVKPTEPVEQLQDDVQTR